MRQSIALFLTLAATALTAPGPTPERPVGLSKRLDGSTDAPGRRSESVGVVVGARSSEADEDADDEEWEGTDDGWDTTTGVCKPATYGCKPCHTGWLVCDGSGTWVSAGDCPEENLCYLDPRNNSPYCVPLSFYDQLLAEGGDV